MIQTGRIKEEMKNMKLYLRFGALLVCTLMTVGCNMETAVPPARELNEVVINSLPSKTVYAIGDTFSLDGLVLEAYYADGSQSVLSAADYTVVSPEPNATLSQPSENLAVKISAGGKNVGFSIIVREKSAQGGSSGGSGSGEGDSSGEGSAGKVEFLYEIDDGRAIVLGIKGSVAALAIPDMLGGFPVKRIESFAFANCTFLTSVSFPKSLEEIGTQAFCGCSAVTALELPENLRRVDTCVFDKCTGLKNITVNCRALDGMPLWNTYNDVIPKLDSVIFSESVKTVLPGPWRTIVSAQEIHIDHPSISLEAGFYRFCGGTLYINTNIPDDCELIYSDIPLQNVVFGKDMTSIGNRCFRKWFIKTILETIVLPDNIEWIGDDAFENQKVQALPANIRHIGSSAFSVSDDDIDAGIQSGVIELPASLEYVGKYAFSCTITEDVDGYPPQVFLTKRYKKLSINCDNIDMYSTFRNLDFDEIVFGENVTTVSGFEYSHITTISFPETITRIADGAFQYAEKLTEITIPSSVREIGDEAFYSCDSLKNVIISEGVEKIGEKAFFNTKISELMLPSTITSLGAIIAGGENSCLTTVTLNNIAGPVETGETRINYEIFGSIIDSPLLTDVYINGNFPEWKPRYSNFHGYPPFRGTEWTAHVGTGIVKIPDGAFYMVDDYDAYYDRYFRDSNGLARIDMSEGVEEIGERAFFASDLTEVVLPQTVRTLGKGAFGRCSRLASVSVPDGVEIIPAYCFYKCAALEKIDLPKNVTGIGDLAFYEGGIKEFRCGKNVSYVGNQMLSSALQRFELNGIVFNWLNGGDEYNWFQFLGETYNDTTTWMPNLESFVIGGKTIDFFLVGSAYPNLKVICFDKDVESITQPFFAKYNGYSSFGDEKIFTNTLDSLDTIVFLSSRPPVVNFDFPFISPNIRDKCNIINEKMESNAIKMYVPDNSVEIYKKSYSEYASIIMPLSGIPENRRSLIWLED